MRNDNLFGTDGVRGFAFGDKINPLSCSLMGAAFGLAAACCSAAEDEDEPPLPSSFNAADLGTVNLPPQGRIAIARDTRESSFPIYNSVVGAISSLGITVVDCGVVHVGALSACIVQKGCLGGVMISASHNVYWDNGLKFFDKNGRKINKRTRDIMAHFVEALSLKWSVPFNGIGPIESVDAADVYCDLLLNNKLLKRLAQRCGKKNHGGSKLKIVVDCSNGAACGVAKEAFAKFGFDPVFVFDKPSGININADCGATATAALCDEVLKCKADVGFAFDGDGDRLVVVDQNGKPVAGEKLIAFFALNLKDVIIEQAGEVGGFGDLQKCKLAKDDDGFAEKKPLVVTTVASNSSLESFLISKGFDVAICEVGDQAVVEKMRLGDGIVGGEESGHIIIANTLPVSDCIFNSLLFLFLLSCLDGATGELTTDPAPTPFLKFNISCQSVSNRDYSGVLERLQQKYLTALQKKAGHGAKLLIRQSGTEAKIRVYMECEDVDFMKSVSDNLKDEILKVAH